MRRGSESFELLRVRVTNCIFFYMYDGNPAGEILIWPELARVLVSNGSSKWESSTSMQKVDSNNSQLYFICKKADKKAGKTGTYCPLVSAQIWNCLTLHLW